MNSPTLASKTSTPWHVWLIGVLALLWNGISAFDYFMTTTHFYSFPMWVDVSWGLYVFAGIIGALALLFRKRWAVSVFALSLVAMVITSLYVFATNGFSVRGGVGPLIFSAMTFIVAVALLLYALRLTHKGVLR